METKICTKCKIVKNLKKDFNFNRNKAGYESECKKCGLVVRMKWRRKNKDRVIEIRKRYAEKIKNLALEKKQEVFKKLGGKCKRCGLKDKRVLQIDHINGGGTKNRKKHHRSLLERYQIIENGMNDFQILCANCNWIKKYENNEGARLLF